MRRAGEYRHKVTLCRSRDTVVGQDIFIARDPVFTAAAAIMTVRGAFFMSGFAIDESRNLYSHNIFIRIAPRFDITGAAWVYEKRKLTPSRWYKILQIEDHKEESHEWRFLVRLVQKSDDIQQPLQPIKDRYVSSLPPGVKL